jgi:alkylation response protein AidB-like acyl-CoA dehydrogenase
MARLIRAVRGEGLFGMTTLIGPGGLAARLTPTILGHAEELEHGSRIPDQLLDELRAAGALRLLTPSELGGYETPLNTLLQVYEEFARLDASVAWVVWNANFGFIGSTLPESGAAKIWTGSTEPVFANSGTPGLAEPVDGGYRLSGHWKLVSGVDAADWLVVLAIVMEGDAPRLTPGNTPQIRACAVPKDQVTVRDTWNVNGMRATGSNDVVIDGLVLAADLTVAIDAPARIGGPLYRGFTPALVLAGCTAVVLSVAQAAIDETVQLAATKKSGPTTLAEQPRAQAQIASSQADLRAARLLLFDAADTVTAAGSAVTAQQRADLRAAMSHAAAVSRRVLVAMYELASSSSIYVGSPLERRFRDGMVALQHANHSAAGFEGAGRVRFGLDPAMPLF